MDPGRFLHIGTQAPQCLAAHLDNQVAIESPRAISRTRFMLPSNWLHHSGQHQLYIYTVDLGTTASIFCLRNERISFPALREKHGEQHEGQHYNISFQDLKTVFSHGLPPRFVMQVKTFNEACLMVRRPALELLHYLKNTNFAHPAVRYVFCIL
ncbi:hypothetical protein DBR06_SOUSAS8610034, partial [Sousa chinensis]